jgi:hypothetical protein
MDYLQVGNNVLKHHSYLLAPLCGFGCCRAVAIFPVDASITQGPGLS